MKSNLIRLSFLVGAVMTVGCSAAAPEPTQGAAPTATSPAPRAVVAGYVHSVEASRFRIGDHPVLEVDGPKLRRWRGTNGAFAHDPSNGWTMALLDANVRTGEYELDEARHHASVKQYFIDAGIPADQIADVKATYESVGGGSQSDAATSRPVKLKSINSILVRAIRGIPVAESYAWAKMTTGGEVDMESVFWPEIPQSVVDRAVALAEKLKGERERASFKAKLGGRIFREGGVVIHHSSSSIHEAPTAFVSFDATVDDSSSAAMHHFDEKGIEFRLPHEEPISAMRSVKTP